MEVLSLMFLLFGIAFADISHLDRLLNRLDVSTQPPMAELTTPEPLHRVRHSHLLRDIKEDYEEEDEEEDEEQADHVQRSPYSTSKLELESGPSNVGEWHQVRKAGSQRVAVATAQDKQKGRSNWNEYYSTRKNNQKIWNNYHSVSAVKSSNNDPKSNNEVRLHLMQMSKEFSCRVPQPKIIQVADHYPSVSSTYYPPCTRLHVCAEDTGCCGPTQKCGPKASQKVELYFYVSVGSPSFGGHYNQKLIKIEKLTFYNHTECTCQDRTDEMPRDTDLKGGLDSNRIPNQPAPYRCKCPSEYTVRNLANGSCTCDCFDKQRDCTKYKKGKENFNHHDRICIETGKCTIPSCDFGVFNRRLGRCPRKHEKFRSWPRYKA